jgi:hypothetical protein
MMWKKRRKRGRMINIQGDESRGEEERRCKRASLPNAIWAIGIGSGELPPK